MSQAVNRILEEVRNLSPEERLCLREALNTQSLVEDSPRQFAAKELFGKYAYASTSSAEFCARKAAEMLWEEHS